MRTRMRAGALIWVVAAVLSSCSGEGSGPDEREKPSRPSAEEALERDRARARRRLGDRPDFKIPQRAIAGKDDYETWFTAIERIFLELDTPYRPDPRLERLTGGQRALYVLHWANSEILNGGFSQLYFNSTGYFAADIPDAAAHVGAAEHARLAAAANAVLAGRGGDVPRNRVARQRLLDGIPQRKFDRIDNRWFDLDEVLAHRAARYARSHRPEFFTP
jgi:hypothetical protein